MLDNTANTAMLKVLKHSLATQIKSTSNTNQAVTVSVESCQTNMSQKATLPSTSVTPRDETERVATPLCRGSFPSCAVALLRPLCLQHGKRDLQHVHPQNCAMLLAKGCFQTSLTLRTRGPIFKPLQEHLFQLPVNVFL